MHVNFRQLQEIPSRQTLTKSRFSRSKKFKILWTALVLLLLLGGLAIAIAVPFVVSSTLSTTTTENNVIVTSNSFLGNSTTAASTTSVSTVSSTSTTVTSTSTSSTASTTSTSVTSTTTTSTTTTVTTTTLTSTSTSTTTYLPYYRMITNSSDTIFAIYNSTAGGPSLNSTAGYGVGQYVPSQGPTICIDFANTTCLNFGNSGQNLSAVNNRAGIGTGLITIPLAGASIARSIQFQTGGDAPNRDPLSFTLEGSNATGSALFLGSVWTILYSGSTGLEPYNVTRFAWAQMENFTNTQIFTAYRMIVTSQRGADYCTQFAEMHLFGIY